MTNNLASNVDTRVLKTFVEGFMDSLIVCNTVDRQLFAGKWDEADVGSNVYVKRPLQANTIETSGGDLTSESKDNLIVGRAAGTVQNYITAYTGWTSLEEATQLNQLERLLEPFARKMATTLEQNLITFMKNYAGLASGSQGNVINAWSDIAAFGSTLDAVGAMGGKRYALVDPFVRQNLADVQKGLFSGDLVSTAWEQARIPTDFGGLTALTHNALPMHTAGTATDTGLQVDGASQNSGYVTVKDSMTQTLSLKGAGNGATITAGTVLEIPSIYYLEQQSKTTATGADGAGLPFTCTVVADATADGTGDIDVTISPPIIVDATNPQYNNVSAAPADSAPVTLKSGENEATSKPALFYCENAFALQTVKLPKLHSIDSQIMTLPELGFSIRQHKFSDGIKNEQSVRWDILPVFASLNPMMAGKGWGRA